MGLCRGRGRGRYPGLEEAARTKMQEKEQFPGREVCVSSRYEAPSSVAVFCLSQLRVAFASSKQQSCWTCRCPRAHPATRIFRTLMKMPAMGRPAPGAESHSTTAPKSIPSPRDG